MEKVQMHWNVINPIFCLEESNNCSLVSPEFRTKSLKCKLILKVNRTEDTVSLFMEHDTYKWKLSETLLSYTFFYECDSVCFCAEELPSIHLASQQGGFVGFISYSDLKRKFRECMDFHITLKMTAYLLSPGPNPTLMFTKTSSSFHDDMIDVLIEDFQNLYESEQFSDLVIKLKDGEIHSHRAILVARSKELARKLNTGEAEISFYDHTVDEFKRLLQVLYTGKLTVDTFFTCNWAGFCNFLQSFDISEINQSQRDIYLDVRAGTSISLKTIVFFCEFSSFSKLQGTVKSPCREAFNGSVWNGEIEIRNAYISVFVRKIKGINEPNRIAKLTVFLLKTTDEDFASELHMTKYFQFPNIGERIGFQVFIPTDILNKMASKVLQNDCLRICCKVVTSEGDPTTFQNGTVECCIPPTCARSSFSNDFAMLLASGEFSDMTVTAQYKSFNVHRSILAARSPVFTSIFKEINLNTHFTFKFSGMSSDTLEIMMVYIYTGKIGRICRHSYLELYLAAEKYSMTNLKRRCSFFLGNLVNEFYAPIYLIVAHENEDSNLKDDVMTFIKHHIFDLIAIRTLRHLIDYSDSLAKEVCRTFAESWIRDEVEFKEDESDTLTKLAVELSIEPVRKI